MPFIQQNMYKQRSQKEFEYHLSRIRRDNSQYLRHWEDVTDITPEHPEYGKIMEFIYEYATRNRAAFLMIFSSVDTRTKRTRECGDDAVRLVYRWETKNGDIFSKAGSKVTRQENLFTHLEERLVKAARNCFHLGQNYKNWEKSPWQ